MELTPTRYNEIIAETPLVGSRDPPLIHNQPASTSSGISNSIENRFKLYCPFVIEESYASNMPRATLNLSLPVFPIMLPAMVHFTLICLALLWVTPAALIFSYLMLLLVAIWASHDKESILSIFIYIYILLFTVVTDIIILAYYWDDFNVNSMGRFSAAMIVINLLLKPPSCVFTVFILYQRNGGFNLDYFKNRGRDAYNDIGGSVDVENGAEGHDNN